MPNIGRETIGVGTRSLNGNAKGLRITMPAGSFAAGVTISAYIADSATGAEFTAFIMQFSDLATILAEGTFRANISTAGWYTFSGSGLATFTPAASTDYVIGVASTSAGASTCAQDTAGLTGYTVVSGVTDCTPLTFSGSPPRIAVDAGRDYSIYMTYTDASSGLPVKIGAYRRRRS